MPPTHGIIPWKDEYNTPTLKELRSGIQDEEMRNAFDLLRTKLLEIEEIEEHLEWKGDCWHWSFVYTLPSLKDPLALVICAPEDVQISMPLERHIAEAIPTRRMKRAIRDGLELAQEPFDTNWAVWSVTTKSSVPDIFQVVKHRIQLENTEDK